MRTRIPILPILIMLLCPATALQASDTNRFIDQAAIDRVMDKAAQKGFEGVIGISDQNGTFYQQAYGDAVKGKVPYADETLIDIASITKQFTGAAILKLREQGKLELTDRLDRFFPDAPSDKAGITLHQLLTHTAGMPDLIGRDEEPISRDAYLARAFASPLVAQPGERYEYSNMGFSLLAAVIEMVSGQPYEDYLFENLWQPTGMFTTGYYRPDWRGHSVPHIEEPVAGLVSQKQLLDRTHGNNWHLVGNGGLLSTASDMLKWHRALLGGDILTADSKALLMTPHVSEGEEGFYYGYGWSVVPDFHGHKLVWHNGGSYFSRADFWRLPESGFAIFIATHTEAVEPYFTADALAKLLIGAPTDADKP